MSISDKDSGTEGSFSQPTEKGVFARDATGLVREVSALQAGALGASSGPLGLLVFFSVPLLALFSGPHAWPVWVAVGIVTLGVIPNLLNYASLTAVMPRSGGDYVFASRLIRPDVGFASSLSLAVSQIVAAGAFAAISVTAISSPLLTMLGAFLDSPTLASWAADVTKTGWVIALGGLLLLAVVLSLVKGTSFALKVNLGAYAIGVGAVLLMFIGLLVTSREGFTETFNAEMNDPNAYQGVIDAARDAGAQVETNFTDSIWPMVAVFAFIVGWWFWATYVGGEVRQAGQSRRALQIFLGPMVFTVLGVVLVLAVMFKTFGYDFLTSVNYLALVDPGQLQPEVASGPPLYLAGLALGSGFLAVLTVVMFIAWAWVVCLIVLLQPIRASLAWSMDQVFPEVFTRVSSRTHTPIGATLAIGVVAVAILVWSTQSDIVFDVFAVAVVQSAIFSWGITGLSAIFLARRHPELYRQTLISKYHPLLAITGFLTIAFVAFWTAAVFAHGDVFGMTTGFVVYLVAVFVGGLGLFHGMRKYRERQGIPVSLAYDALPPE